MDTLLKEFYDALKGGEILDISERLSSTSDQVPPKNWKECFIARRIAEHLFPSVEPKHLPAVADRWAKQAISEGMSVEEVVVCLQKYSIEGFQTVDDILEKYGGVFKKVKVGDVCKTSGGYLSKRASLLVYLAEDGTSFLKSKNRLTLIREKAAELIKSN